MTIETTFLARLRQSLAKLLIPGVLDRLASQQAQIERLEAKIHETQDDILVALQCVDDGIENVEARVRAEIAVCDAQITALTGQLTALEAELLRFLPAAAPDRGEG